MKKIIKRVLVLSLVVATAIGTMTVTMPTTNVTAAKTKSTAKKSKKSKKSKSKKQKIYLVTKEADNDGNTIYYSYDKNGFVTKVKKSKAYKTKSSDYSYSATTYLKYNKKNRVSSKKFTSYGTTTSYELDFDDHIKSGGKVTKTSNKNISNTVYYYDKKGLLVKTVKTAYSLEIPQNKVETETEKITYHDGNENKDVEGIKKITKTTTYTDNGNGTLTKTFKNDTVEPTYSKEKKQVVDSTFNRTETTLTTNKTVITTTYKYDKKKRVKYTITDNTTTNTTKVNNYRVNSTDGVKDNDHLTETVTTSVSTKRTTDTYSYNKYGKVSKIVSVAEPKVNSSSQTDKKNTNTTYSSDGKSETTVTSSTEKTECSNNKKIFTSSSTDKEGKVTTADPKIVYYPANKNNSTTTYTYDKKGNLKSESNKTVHVDNRVIDYTVDENGNKINKYNKLQDGSDDKDSPIYKSVTTTSKRAVSYKNILKSNTSRISEGYSLDSGKREGRVSNSSYTVNRHYYKLKSKKLSNSIAKDVEAQQFILQNGFLNGKSGLN